MVDKLIYTWEAIHKYVSRVEFAGWLDHLWKRGRFAEYAEEVRQL